MKQAEPTRLSRAVAAVLLACGTLAALAHHSAAPFDMAKSVSVQGTVEKWSWTNPHCWLYVTVDKDDGTHEVWGFEAGSTGMLARSGWNAADMKPGDKVKVTAAPARDGNHVGLINQVQLAGGKVLGAGAGAPPPGADGRPPGATGNHPPTP